VLAYVFWHVRAAGVDAAEYEARLAAFHAALRTVFGVAPAPVVAALRREVLARGMGRPDDEDEDEKRGASTLAHERDRR